VLIAILLAASAVAQAQATQTEAKSTYTGNGATGFSGYLGKGSLTVARDAQGNITFSLAPQGGVLGGNGVVVYVDSTLGGFADTSQLSDNGDPGHEIISGTNTGTNPAINDKNSPSRSLVTFPGGFQADYALSFEDSYVGLFKLAAGKDNSLIYIAGASQRDGRHTLTIPGSDIGISSSQRFSFVASLISGANAYRSNETIGDTVQGNAGQNPGSNGSITFTEAKLFPTSAAVANIGLTDPVGTSVKWNAGMQGDFVTALCRDSRGNIWAATEGQGVWRFTSNLAAKPVTSPWTQFIAWTPTNGPGDNDCYALCCDQQGRIWCGTGRHGVSVFNGRNWRSYGPLQGLVGSHVFALAVCPTTGDVWIATEGGLTRYAASGNRWTNYLGRGYFPSGTVSSLGFSKDGMVYAGTQADGIAVASPLDGYAHWRTISGPARPPAATGGPGLPSNLVNCLLVSRDGTIYAGTDDGLARSYDGGSHWRFLRGSDAPDRVAGPSSMAPNRYALLEDHVECLAEDAAGHLWVGHWQAGFEVLDPGTGKRLYPGPADPHQQNDVASLLPLDHRAASSSMMSLVGGHGPGLLNTLVPIAMSPFKPPVEKYKRLLLDLAPLPLPAGPPSLAELNLLLKLAQAVPPDPREMQPKAVALEDDWATQGDWLGRYGRFWANLNALCSPSDYQWGAGWEPVGYAAQAGKAPAAGDSIRYWVQSLYTSDPRTLELPPTYLDSRIKKKLTYRSQPRREAEQDDHGEAYSMNVNGLGVYQTVAVPAGLYILSLYEMNPGYSLRDFRLSVRPHAARDLVNLAGFEKQPEWAHGRVVKFWGGVWKRFLVRGPVTLDVEVGANHSYDTLVQAVMLDLTDELPPPYFGTVKNWQSEQSREAQERRSLMESWARASAAQFSPVATASGAADQIFLALDRAHLVNSSWWGMNARHFYGPLLRWYMVQSTNMPPAGRDAVAQRRFLQRLGTCYYQMGMYPQWEACLKMAGSTPARDVEEALRWDGVSDSGQGYIVVNGYLASQHGAKTSKSR